MNVRVNRCVCIRGTDYTIGKHVMDDSVEDDEFFQQLLATGGITIAGHKKAKADADAEEAKPVKVKPKVAK